MKFDEQTRSSIKRALATSQLQDAHLEVVQFISAQLPRDIIMSTTSTEDAEESDSHSVLQSILVLLMVRFLFEEAGQYNLRWQLIADVPGLDITALLYRGEVIGAAVGFYSNAEHAYLTHVCYPSELTRGRRDRPFFAQAATSKTDAAR